VCAVARILSFITWFRRAFPLDGVKRNWFPLLNEKMLHLGKRVENGERLCIEHYSTTKNRFPETDFYDFIKFERKLLKR